MLPTMTEKPPIETETPPLLNMAAPCRVASSETNLLGECMRCRTKVGEPCPMSRTE